MTARSFPPRVDALDELFAFTAATGASAGIDLRALQAIDLTLEELFTNVVKYGRSRADIVVEMRVVGGEVRVTLTAADVERFDVTRGPAVDTTLPLEQRQPGGLGLHLIRQLVDSIEYEYQDAQRLGRVTFCKTLA